MRGRKKPADLMRVELYSRRDFDEEFIRICEGYNYMIERFSQRFVVRSYFKTAEDQDWAYRELPSLQGEWGRTLYQRWNNSHTTPEWEPMLGNVTQLWQDHYERTRKA
jgi:hypothetical protein